ncbi:MAG: hypothetical protein U1B80_02210 [Anaerolineaceae bacterium]|nr:hypothetical protein [Anaerolineaceae bacterium]
MERDKLGQIADALCARRGASGKALAYCLLEDGSMVVVCGCGRKLRFTPGVVQAMRALPRRGGRKVKPALTATRPDGEGSPL